MKLGDRIKKQRKSLGLTQVQLAEKLGTTQAVITNYERNLRRPPVDKMPEIANALSIPIEQLFENTKNDFSVTKQPKRSKRMSKLVSIFSELSAMHQRALLQQAEGLVLRSKKNSTHTPTT